MDQEKQLQQHIWSYLESQHQYKNYNTTKSAELCQQDYHIVEKDLLAFLQATQQHKLNALQERYTHPFDEIIKHLKKTIDSGKKPLWLIMREGLEVGGEKVELYIPYAWKNDDDAKTQNKNAEKNIFAFKEEYLYNPSTDERVDLVLWLNGLPIIVLELKHSPVPIGFAVKDLVDKRDATNTLFKLPFAYFATTDTEVKVATSVAHKQGFLPFNSGLINQAKNKGEYAIEFLYADILSPRYVLNYLEGFLIFNPPQEKNGKIIKHSFSIFPRYHQLATALNVSQDIKNYFNTNNTLGKNYLINHSAGSGKTYTIAWLSYLLHKLYNKENNKLFDSIIIITDRLSLDKNIADDLEKFTHLKGNIKEAKNAKQLTQHLNENSAIITTTLQKFAFTDVESGALADKKIALLIDEAHRSQGGEYTQNLENIILSADELGIKNTTNLSIIAFTATATKQTIALFDKPFAVYSEDQAIREGYILDVIDNIISFQTLYNIKYKDSNLKDYPTGILAKMIRDKAYADDELIIYKSQIILQEFEKSIKDKIGGKAKIMVVAPSRIAGLKYYKNISQSLKDSGANYKVLYAFSDFEHNGKTITENEINKLEGAKIEDIFKQDDYRIMIVANKFQTGFDEPLLTALFLDKVVNEVNAVQTLSRLNRRCDDKGNEDVVVYDFTGNTAEMKQAFLEHREGSPAIETEVDESIITQLAEDILSYNVVSKGEIIQANTAYGSADFSNIVERYKAQFENKISDNELRKDFVSVLKKYTKHFLWLSNFVRFDEEKTHIFQFAKIFSQLLLSSNSTLTDDIKNIEISKTALKLLSPEKIKKPSKNPTNTGGGNSTPSKSTLDEVIDKINNTFNINNNETLLIKKICTQVANKEEIRESIIENMDNYQFYNNYKRQTIKPDIRKIYSSENEELLKNEIYIKNGGIIDMMSNAVITLIKQSA